MTLHADNGYQCVQKEHTSACDWRKDPRGDHVGSYLGIGVIEPKPLDPRDRSLSFPSEEAIKSGCRHWERFDSDESTPRINLGC